MGCNASEVADNGTGDGNEAYLLGTNAKGPLVLMLHQSKLSDIRPKISLPRFCNALLVNPKEGYLTGGIEEMTEYEDSKKVFNPSDKLKVFEGTLTKSFSRLDIGRMRAGQSDALTKLPDMANVRYAHCSTMLNGKLYVLGGRQYGEEDAALLSACERFNFETNVWQTVPPLQKGRSSFNCLVYKQCIYAFSGYTGKNKRSRSIETYKQDSEGWKLLPVKLHTGVQGAIIIPSSSNSFYIFGGKTNIGNTNQVVEVNLQQLSIKHRNPTKEKRSFQKYYRVKQNVYLMGGLTEQIEIYNMETEQLTTSAEPNYLQYCSQKELSAFAQLQYPAKIKDSNENVQRLDSKVQKLFILGHARHPLMRIIDINTEKTVDRGQQMAFGFYEFRTTLKVNEQYVFILGGLDSTYTHVTNRAQSLHLPTEQVKSIPEMINKRYGFPAVVKGSYAYVFGGRRLGTDEQAIMNQCERFSFEKEKWEAIAPMKLKRHSSMAMVIGNSIVVVGGYKGNGILSSDLELYNDSLNKWYDIERKFGLAIQSMTIVEHRSQIFLFGGRTDEGDVSKVFRLDVQLKGDSRPDKALKLSLDPVGSMTEPGSGLKIVQRRDGKAVIFGLKNNTINIYDLDKQQVLTTESSLKNRLNDLDESTLKSCTFIH